MNADFSMAEMGTLDDDIRHPAITASHDHVSWKDTRAPRQQDTELNTDDKDEVTNNPAENDSSASSQLTDTLNWLSENYERADGVCLPRCILYAHYLDLCKKKKYSPAGAATFGKIIRQKFPKLTTRRLGTRGQSKYHYYGIGIKETSVYYHSVYAGKGLTRFSGVKVKTEGSNRKHSLNSKTGTLLPKFPDAENMVLPPTTDRQKMQTFMMMYHTHCQRILDSIIGANFVEIQSFLLHFWQGMPTHLVELLSLDSMPDLLTFCDSVLYKVMNDVLIPNNIQDLPDSLGCEIRAFIKHMPTWINNALEDAPDELRCRKIEVAKHFVRHLRRQVSFMELAQTARAVLTNQDHVTQMVKDLADVNFGGICMEAGLAGPQKHAWLKAANRAYDEFRSMLEKQTPIETYTEWLDGIIESHVLKFEEGRSKCVKERAAEFLLKWSIMGSLVMRDLTLHRAATFGSFHLLHTTLDEYIFLIIETQDASTRDATVHASVKKLLKHARDFKMAPTVRSNKNQQSPKLKRKPDNHINTDTKVPKTSDSGCCKTENSCAGADCPPVPTWTSRFQGSEVKENAGASFPSPGSFPPIPHIPSPLSPGKHISNLHHCQGATQNGFPGVPIPSLHNANTTNNYPYPTSRFSSCKEVSSGPFMPVPIHGSMPHGSNPYWTESRPYGTISDPYLGYHGNWNKGSAAYDNYGPSNYLFRPGGYSDALPRPTIDHGFSYYGRNTETGHQFHPGTFSSSAYPDMTYPSQASFPPRQEQYPIMPQDEFCASSITPFHSALSQSIPPPFGMTLR